MPLVSLEKFQLKAGVRFEVELLSAGAKSSKAAGGVVSRVMVDVLVAKGAY